MAKTQASQAADFGTCQTPAKESGRCVHIEDCQFLLDLLVAPSDRDVEFLQQSQCGYDNTQTLNTRRVIVCCADKNASAWILPSTALNNLPEPGVCGEVFSNRIYGGNAASIDEFPWLALIQYKKSHNTYGFNCNACLINHRYVLTAAHCLKAPKKPETWEVHRVRLGEWDLQTNPDCEEDIRGNKECAPPHVDVAVERMLIHPDYIPDSREQFHDIALIRLAQSVEYSDYIKPICLPRSPQLRSSTFQGTIMDVAGWGMNDYREDVVRKQKIAVEVWNMTACEERFSSWTNIGASQMCAGGEQNVDTCGNDSGGPLMLKERFGNRDIYFAAGVASFGSKPCGLANWPGVYTRVNSFVGWIQDNLEP